MDQPTDEFGILALALVLLAAAVISVPIARRIGLPAIVAYLIAGIIIGPYGIGVFRTPASILGVAELGIVMLMFVIGLELELGKLLAMRRAIVFLGGAQLALTALAIAALAFYLDLLSWRGALVAGLALALSATAIALEILEERGQLQHLYGQRAFAILLFQDMAVVPLLALLPLLSDGSGGGPHGDMLSALRSVAFVGGAIAAVVAAGRYLLNPFFRLLAATRAREAMTAASLLVVLGAALIMLAAGMSMALGAFLAGVLLAESNYRHELEADIEPFRGLLLSLFFMGIGMTIDMTVVRAHIGLILAAALVLTVLKAAIVYLLFRVNCPRTDALRAGSVLTGAGEFAFVLVPFGVTLAVFDARQASLLTAIAAITMLLGPPVAALSEFALRRLARRDPHEADDFSDAHGSVLLIGFGRFGQIVSQCLLAEDIDVTIIDKDPDMIRDAGGFGFKIYYGDGTRLDVLCAAGAGKARLIAVCIDDREAASRVVDLVHAEFSAKVFVRAYDRRHTLQLIAQGADFHVRETFESALVFGRHALEALDLAPERAGAVIDFVRERDDERFALQQAEGIRGGIDLLRARMVQTPLSEPEQEATPLNAEAEAIIEEEKEKEAGE
jgi:monovalent cation:proton antiporter-2 (CPA2) family protein